MIEKKVPSKKVKLTKINKIDNYEDIFRRHLNFINSGEEPRPVEVIYDKRSRTYLIYDGNKRAIGHKLEGKDITVSIIEEKDGFEDETGIVFRVGKICGDFNYILNFLKEKSIQTKTSLKQKKKIGEIPKEVYDLLI